MKQADGYATICISLYTEDLTRLDTMVDKLKARVSIRTDHF